MGSFLSQLVTKPVAAHTANSGTRPSGSARSEDPIQKNHQTLDELRSSLALAAQTTTEVIGSVAKSADADQSFWASCPEEDSFLMGMLRRYGSDCRSQLRRHVWQHGKLRDNNEIIAYTQVGREQVLWTNFR